ALSAARTAVRSAAPSAVRSAAPSAVTSGVAADLLRRLADGSVTAALAVGVAAAPGAAFPDAAQLAGPQPGDKAEGVFRLRGHVRSVADALPADVLLVPAEGVPNGLFLVEATAAGVHRVPVTSLDMTRQLCDISLDGAPGRQVAVGADAAAAIEAGL